MVAVFILQSKPLGKFQELLAAKAQPGNKYTVGHVTDVGLDPSLGCTCVQTYNCHFTALIFYSLCTSQGTCTRVGDEFIIHCFSLYASHLGKIHTRINEQFNSACKFHSWTLQDPYVQILLMKKDCDTNYVCYFSPKYSNYYCQLTASRNLIKV